MLDTVMVALVLVLTVVTLAYMWGCDVMLQTDSTRDESRSG